MKFLIFLFAGCGFDVVRNPDLAGADLAGVDLSQGATNCRTQPLPCLDPSEVIDVPSEADRAGRVHMAKPGEIIQIRGLDPTPAFVCLRR